MNNRQRAQLERYTPAFGTLEFVTLTKGGVTLECRDCDKFTTFTNAQVRYSLASGKPLRCECTPECHTPDGFTLLEECKDYRLLSCDNCGLEYHRELRSRYFTCYCAIRTKRGEETFYKFLKENFRERWSYASREEHYPGSRHKADIKFKALGVTFYVEIDGSSHNSTYQKDLDREHEASFLEHRGDTDYLIRIDERKLADPDWEDSFLDFLLEFDPENGPISHF